MKEFEVISSGGVMVNHFRIPAEAIEAVSAIFGGEEFDMATAGHVVLRIDEAKLRLQTDPDNYRDMLPEGSRFGLRKIRNVLDTMRELLVRHPEATVSGLVDEYVPAEA